MNRSSLVEMPEFYDRYIMQVEDVPVVEALSSRVSMFFAKEIEKLHALGDRVYAPGKWTIRDVMQHVIDNERVMQYRAMRIARNDQTPLPGYDEKSFAAEAQAGHRDIENLLEEFSLLRQSGLFMFRNFSPEMLGRKGECSGRTISVLALGFVLAGHQQHHENIVRERYFPLLEQE